MRKCHFCHEAIPDAAVVCAHCGRDLIPGRHTSPPMVTPPTSAPPPTLKMCPFCAEEIQAAAIKCKHCGSLLDQPAASAAPARRPTTASEGSYPGETTGSVAPVTAKRKTSLWTWVVLGFVVLVGVNFLDSLINAKPTTQLAATPSAVPTQTVTSSTPPPEPVYQLALLSARGYPSDGGGYHIVEGQVKNLSNQPLKNVTAVATWFGKDGGFIKSDNAIIAYNPILPGQTSPFKTMSSTNPAMEKYTVGFKTLFGGSLAVDDQRHK
jgi:hypothetical protein